MIIIDKPYTSDFLIETIKKNKFKIISTSEARDLISDNSLNWITEEEARSIVRENPHTPIYTNSENSIGWIEKNFSSSPLPKQIEIFKNKVKFRELLHDLFPDYFFKGIKVDELFKLNVNSLKYPIIIKPAVGFFSMAVYRAESNIELGKILDKIQSEIRDMKDLYPKEVLNLSDFIIEEVIEGEEYAIDCYFDNNGEPVLLNILHHLYSSNKDVNDRVYSTSEEIIEKYKNKILTFLKTIGERVKLKNFPAHVEVRINSEGDINPIEVNPLRFGGWCTTADLTWHAFGFNSYEYFIMGKKPNWEHIYKSIENKKYNIIVLDNNSGIKGSEVKYFDYDNLLKDFSQPLTLRKVDFNKFPLFGFLFAETKIGDDAEINNILNSDLRKYIRV